MCPALTTADAAQPAALQDFGLALEATTRSVRSGRMGTLLYMPPELLDGRHYNNKCDIWSLGCILYANANAKPSPSGSQSSAAAAHSLCHGIAVAICSTAYTLRSCSQCVRFATTIVPPPCSRRCE